MVFSKKVNRLEYITRMGFDNTVDEKKELMAYFSQLDRAEILNAARIAALEAREQEMIAALEKYALVMNSLPLFILGNGDTQKGMKLIEETRAVLTKVTTK